MFNTAVSNNCWLAVKPCARVFNLEDSLTGFKGHFYCIWNYSLVHWSPPLWATLGVSQLSAQTLKLWRGSTRVYQNHTCCKYAVVGRFLILKFSQGKACPFLTYTLLLPNCREIFKICSTNIGPMFLTMYLRCPIN